MNRIIGPFTEIDKSHADLANSKQVLDNVIIDKNSPLAITLAFCKKISNRVDLLYSEYGGNTEKKAELMQEVATEKKINTDYIFHQMAYVTQHDKINKGKPVMISMPRPVSGDIIDKNMMMKSGVGYIINLHGTLQQVAMHEGINMSKKDKFTKSTQDILDIIQMTEGGVNILISSEVLKDWKVYVQMPDPIKDANHYIELPLGPAGQEVSVVMDSAAFCALMYQLRKRFNNIEILGEKKSNINNADDLLKALKNTETALKKGEKAAIAQMEQDTKTPLLGRFQRFKGILKKEITIQSEPSNMLPDYLIQNLLDNLIYNFFAVEGNTIKIILEQILNNNVSECKQALNQMYDQMKKINDYGKALCPWSFDEFINLVAIEFGKQPPWSSAICQLLRNIPEGEKTLKNIAKKNKIQSNLKITDFNHPVFDIPKINVNSILEKKFPNFSSETAKTQEYFEFHTEIISQLPSILQKFRNNNYFINPLKFWEKLKQDFPTMIINLGQNLAIKTETKTAIANDFFKILFSKIGNMLTKIDEIAKKLSQSNSKNNSAFLLPEIELLLHLPETQLLFGKDVNFAMIYGLFTPTQQYNIQDN